MGLCFFYQKSKSQIEMLQNPKNPGEKNFAGIFAVIMKSICNYVVIVKFPLPLLCNFKSALFDIFLQAVIFAGLFSQ